MSDDNSVIGNGGYVPRRDPTYVIVNPEGVEESMTFANGRDIIRYDKRWQWKDGWGAVYSAHHEWSVKEGVRGGLNRGVDLSESDREITRQANRERGGG